MEAIRMENNQSEIATQAVAQLVETPFGDEIGQQLVAQLVNISWADTINLLFGLPLSLLKIILSFNIPAKPMGFELSNFMLKSCGFSFFNLFIISLVTKPFWESYHE